MEEDSLPKGWYESTHQYASNWGYGTGNGTSPEEELPRSLLGLLLVTLLLHRLANLYVVAGGAVELGNTASCH